jgi:hypothetical protein
MMTIVRLSAAFLVLITAAGCIRQLDKPVRFVVSKGFKGPFVLIERGDAPKAVVDTPSAYVINVPPSGILALSDGWVLHRFHHVQAQYADGAEIPVQDFWEGFGLHAGPCALYGNGGPSDPSSVYYNWFYIGLSQDAGDFLGSDPHGPPVDGAKADKLQQKWLHDHGIDLKHHPPHPR